MGRGRGGDYVLFLEPTHLYVARIYRRKTWPFVLQDGGEVHTAFLVTLVMGCVSHGGWSVRLRVCASRHSNLNFADNKIPSMHNNYNHCLLA